MVRCSRSTSLANMPGFLTILPIACMLAFYSRAIIQENSPAIHRYTVQMSIFSLAVFVFTAFNEVHFVPFFRRYRHNKTFAASMFLLCVYCCVCALSYSEMFVYCVCVCLSACWIHTVIFGKPSTSDSLIVLNCWFIRYCFNNMTHGVVVAWTFLPSFIAEASIITSVVKCQHPSDYLVWGIMNVFINPFMGYTQVTKYDKYSREWLDMVLSKKQFRNGQIIQCSLTDIYPRAKTPQELDPLGCTLMTEFECKMLFGSKQETFVNKLVDKYSNKIVWCEFILHYLWCVYCGSQILRANRHFFSTYWAVIIGVPVVLFFITD